MFRDFGFQTVGFGHEFLDVLFEVSRVLGVGPTFVYSFRCVLCVLLIVGVLDSGRLRKICAPTCDQRFSSTLCVLELHLTGLIYVLASCLFFLVTVGVNPFSLVLYGRIRRHSNSYNCIGGRLVKLLVSVQDFLGGL